MRSFRLTRPPSHKRAISATSAPTVPQAPHQSELAGGHLDSFPRRVATSRIFIPEINNVILILSDLIIAILIHGDPNLDDVAGLFCSAHDVSNTLRTDMRSSKAAGLPRYFSTIGGGETPGSKLLDPVWSKN
jgi:hypothetical protein